MNNAITEDDLQDLSDSEIPVIIDNESDTDDDDKTAAVDARRVTSSASSEAETLVTPPVKQEHELSPPPPILFKDDRSLSPVDGQNEQASSLAVSLEEPSATLREETQSVKVTERVASPSQQSVVEKAISNVTEKPQQPPLLKDDDNLFTTPSDYNVYEEAEQDMASIETQALAMLQQFTNAPAGNFFKCFISHFIFAIYTSRAIFYKKPTVVVILAWK